MEIVSSIAEVCRRRRPQVELLLQIPSDDSNDDDSNNNDRDWLFTCQCRFLWSRFTNEATNTDR
jgi:hypothetical protein